MKMPPIMFHRNVSFNYRSITLCVFNCGFVYYIFTHYMKCVFLLYWLIKSVHNFMF